MYVNLDVELEAAPGQNWSFRLSRGCGFFVQFLLGLEGRGRRFRGFSLIP